MSLVLVRPDWPAPANVHAFSTERKGGFSSSSWCSLNLGPRCGDNSTLVTRNRELLRQYLPAAPQWLHQVHSTEVVTHPTIVDGELEGDALVTCSDRQVCAVLTADCLPVLFCNDSGNRVAVAHAGWRGLAAGVLEATVVAMDEKPENVMTWLGPAIGPLAYQVGDDVRQAFGAKASACFVQTGDRWMFDLYGAARLMLAGIGIGRVYGGGFCTYSEADRFFSFRRDGETGRMASLIWMDPVQESARAEAG